MEGKRSWLMLLVCVAFMAGSAYETLGFTVSGTVSDKSLISEPISTKVKAIVKFKFVIKTTGANVELCAGTFNDFNAGSCPFALGISGAPSVESFSIVDTSQLLGKSIYVINHGTAPLVSFEVTIE
jgi:hypothetical protein